MDQPGRGIEQGQLVGQQPETASDEPEDQGRLALAAPPGDDDRAAGPLGRTGVDGQHAALVQPRDDGTDHRLEQGDRAMPGVRHGSGLAIGQGQQARTAGPEIGQRELGRRGAHVPGRRPVLPERSIRGVDEVTDVGEVGPDPEDDPVDVIGELRRVQGTVGGPGSVGRVADVRSRSQARSHRRYVAPGRSRRAAVDVSGQARATLPRWRLCRDWWIPVHSRPCKGGAWTHHPPDRFDRPGSTRTVGDPVAAAAVAGGDVGVADDVGAEHLAEQRELRLTGSRVVRGDLVDRAVVLDETHGPIGIHLDLGQVALFVLARGDLPDAVAQGGVGRQPFGQSLAHPSARLAAASREDLLDQVVPADGKDGCKEAGREAVVIIRKEVLRLRRHVVQVPRSADAVAFGPAHDELGRLERPELLEDPGPARPEPGGELVGRRRAELAEEHDDVATEGRRGMVAVRARLGLESPTGVRQAGALRIPTCGEG